MIIKVFISLYILFLPVLIYASQISILPETVNFVYNLDKDEIEPSNIKITLTNIDMDGEFTWNIQTESTWINLDNWKGEGSDFYELKISVDKSQLANLAKGQYQGILTINSDISVNIVIVNLFIKPPQKIISYGVNYFNNDDYIKIPLPYSSTWEINPVLDKYFTDSSVLSLIPNNLFNLQLSDTVNNRKMSIKFNKINSYDLYNIKYDAYSATPLDFKLLIPPSNSHVYIKLKLKNFNNIEEATYFYTKDGFTDFEIPYLDDSDLPNLKDVVLDLGTFTIKNAGELIFSIYNDNYILANIIYSLKSISGTWNIIDHFEDNEIMYKLNISEDNGVFSGGIQFNSKYFPISSSNSAITDNGFYILTLAEPYTSFYIKIPYYLISKDHFTGFLMFGSEPISLIEGYKESSSFIPFK